MWYENPEDNPKDPTKDIWHVIVRCPDDIASDGGGGGGGYSSGGSGGGVDWGGTKTEQQEKKPKASLRSSKAFPPTQKELDIIRSFLDKEIRDLPCLDKVPWISKCLDKLLKGPPPLMIGVVRREQLQGQNVFDNDMHIWGSDAWNGNGQASNNPSNPGLVIKQPLFGNKYRGLLKSIIFHELIHQCDPKPDEIEVEIFENLCFPDSDIIETEELEGVTPTIIPGVDLTDPEGNEVPYLMKFKDKYGRTRILLVYDEIIIDPESGDVWTNGSRRKTFPYPNADPIIKGKFKFSKKQIDLWWKLLEGLDPKDDPWGRTQRGDSADNPGLNFIRTSTGG